MGTKCCGEFPFHTLDLVHAGFNDLEDLVIKSRGANIATLHAMSAGGGAKGMRILVMGAFDGVELFLFAVVCLGDLH